MARTLIRRLDAGDELERAKSRLARAERALAASEQRLDDAQLEALTAPNSITTFGPTGVTLEEQLATMQRRARTVLLELDETLDASLEAIDRRLSQIVLDMNSDLVEAKKVVSAMIAQEKRLAKAFEQEVKHSAACRRVAARLVEPHESAAKSSKLVRAGRHENLADRLRTSWSAQKQRVDRAEAILVEASEMFDKAKYKKEGARSRAFRSKLEDARQRVERAIGLVGSVEGEQQIRSALTTLLALQPEDERLARRIGEHRADAERRAKRVAIAEAVGETELARQARETQERHLALIDMLTVTRSANEGALQEIATIADSLEAALEMLPDLPSRSRFAALVAELKASIA